jgi:tRNA(adenine34) deaminase
LDIEHNPGFWMQAALEEARKAQKVEEIPVGAVVVSSGEIIGRGHNSPISSSDPSAHAEIAALRSACRNLGNYRLPGAELYVTLEPCVMCAGALLHARVARLYFGASDPKGGFRRLAPLLLSNPDPNHRVEVIGNIAESACSELLQAFFQKRRGKSGKKE